MTSTAWLRPGHFFSTLVLDIMFNRPNTSNRMGTNPELIDHVKCPNQNRSLDGSRILGNGWTHEDLYYLFLSLTQVLNPRTVHCLTCVHMHVHVSPHACAYLCMTYKQNCVVINPIKNTRLCIKIYTACTNTQGITVLFPWTGPTTGLLASLVCYVTFYRKLRQELQTHIPRMSTL